MSVRTFCGTLTLCVSVAIACGGRVGGGEGTLLRDGGAARGGVGGRAEGGSAGKGGRPAGGSGNTGGLIGSCNPNFCIGSPTAKGCCLGANGPCGSDYGNGCVSSAAGCQSDGDCATTALPCNPCPDGTCAPASSYCSEGSCVTFVSSCPACNPRFCPADFGTPCCVGSFCGIDQGTGCYMPH